MPSSGYYHRQADICVRMALSASSYEERVRLMEVANNYRDRASRGEAFAHDAGQVWEAHIADDKRKRGRRDRSAPPEAKTYEVDIFRNIGNDLQ